MQLRSNLSASRSHCAGKYEYRIRASHFGVERNGFRPADRQIHQSSPGGNRPSEAARFDKRVLNERRSNAGSRVEQKRKHSLGQTLLADALADRVPDKFARAGMR